MLTALKTLTKLHPRVYDALSALRPIRGATEVWLDRFSRRHPGLTFVQVGASDGLRWDPARRFIVRDRWRGVVVEPIPAVFAMLRHNYRHVPGLAFVNVAISDTPGSVEFFVPDAQFLDTLGVEERMRVLRLSSLARDQLAQHIGAAHVASVTVPAQTIAQVVGEHLDGTPDLVVSDAEGFDDRVIYGIGIPEGVAPRAILYESHNLSVRRADALRAFLVAHGYEITTLDGDTVAERGAH